MIARSCWRITGHTLRLVQRVAQQRAQHAASVAVAQVPGHVSLDDRSTTEPWAAATASEPEPYGQAYGAGPSRIPYEPPKATTPADSLDPVSALGATAAGQTRTTTRLSARRIRKTFRKIPYEQLSLLARPMERATADVILGRLGIHVEQLSRLESHVLLHELIRNRSISLAVWVCVNILERLQPSHIPRRVLASQTLSALGSLGAGDEVLPPPIVQAPPGPLTQPTIEEQRPQPPSAYLASLLHFLELLQRVRHPRSHPLYGLVMTRCMNECRPDLAAKVYVALVEEWIVEGRIAEGADPSDFYPGGGPPREPSWRRRNNNSLLKMWFSGVRTWRLPGEALSLHDRLDLWHPYHHSLHERLRGFPMPIPTSPPSLVPHPSLGLLGIIINNIVLDPRQLSPAHYAATLRALAMLANTVLSRTLPVPAIPAMLKAFSESHMEPFVYPESLTKLPEENSWAYTANTQVHVALVSLMFSPPNYARAAEIERRFTPRDTKLPPRGQAGRYMLRPLAWRSCVVLIKYASQKLHQPRIVSRLLDYMKVTFKEWDTSALNVLFRGSTLSRDNELANAIETKLFGQTMLGLGQGDRVKDTVTQDKTAAAEIRGKGEAVSDPRAKLSAEEKSETQPDPKPIVDDTVSTLLDGINLGNVHADKDSLLALVAHLTATSQFDRLIKTVYTILPYLAVSRTSPLEDVQRLAEATGATVTDSGRILPTELPPVLFAAIVNGLAKSGNTGLAQRVFLLAKSYESYAISNDLRIRSAQRAKREIDSRPYWQKSSGENGEAGHVAPSPPPPAARFTLTIHMYTSMIEVYSNEARPRPNSVEQSPRGWKTIAPFNNPSLPRAQAGILMAWSMYEEAMRRWRISAALVAKTEKAFEAGQDPEVHITHRQLEDRTPDARFFRAIIKTMHQRWELDSDRPLSRRPYGEVSRIIRDMTDAGVPVPRGLATKLATGRGDGGAMQPDVAYTKTLVAPREYVRKEMRSQTSEIRDEMGAGSVGRDGLKGSKKKGERATQKRKAYWRALQEDRAARAARAKVKKDKAKASTLAEASTAKGEVEDEKGEAGQ